jgi:hypothetical protein
MYQWSDIGLQSDSTPSGTVLSDDLVVVISVVDNTQPNPIVVCY